MVNSCEYMKVTYSKIDKMKHTIGFRNDRVKGTKHRKYEPFRNYYCAGECDKKELDELCQLGFMENFRENYYYVTNDGKEFLWIVTGVQILDDMR